jgi:16S rRNA processing protein RimM
MEAYDMEDMLQVGVIIKAHGVRGEVKVFPTTDDPARFKELQTAILDNGKEQREVEITSVKFFKNLVILKFKGMDTMNDVEPLRQAKLLVTRDHAVELGENEYFIADLIGMKAVSDEGEALGVITDVLQTGANDVYVIGSEGVSDLLVPAIKDCIRAVDMEQRLMTIHLLPGLRE